MASTVSNSTLQVGLISVPVALKKIKATEDVLIGTASLAGNPVKMPKIDGVTGEALASEDIQKGVWQDEDTFKPIPAEALAELEAATKIEVFEVNEFIPLTAVPWERAQSSYFLAPQKSKGAGPAHGAKAMAILHRGMVKAKAAGVLKIMLRTRQYLAVLYPKGDGLYVTVLAWSEDWKQADEANVLEGVAVPAAVVDQAHDLIKAMMSLDPQGALDSQVDEVRAERAKLVEEALAGKTVKAKAKPKAKAEDNGLEALLAQSLAAAQA